MMNEFPKMLFKPGTAFEWEGMKLDSLTVADADAEAEAFADGWLTVDMLGDDAEPVADAPRRGRPRKAV